MDIDGALEVMPIIADEMRARNMHINAEVLGVVTVEAGRLRDEVESLTLQVEAEQENLMIWKDVIRKICDDVNPHLDTAGDVVRRIRRELR